MKRIVILTGADRRHDFARKAIALCNDIEVVRSFCEEKKNLSNYSTSQSYTEETAEYKHWLRRSHSEDDFFGPFVHLTVDQSKPKWIPKGS